MNHMKAIEDSRANTKRMKEREREIYEKEEIDISTIWEIYTVHTHTHIYI